jgi:hypothetical protein
MLLAVLTVAGCGGGSGKSFESQASDICKTYSAKAKKVPKPQDISGIPAYVDQVLPPIREGVAKLRALKPPSAKQAGYQEYLSLLDQETTLLGEISTAAKAGDSSGLDRLSTQFDDASAQDVQKAKQLGLGACS